MSSKKHTILGGKVHVYKRENSLVWQCSTYLSGKNRRISTREESLALAKEFAEDWYMTLLSKKREGTLIESKAFKEAAEQYLIEFDILTENSRNRQYVRGHERRARLYLNPFLGSKRLQEITSGVIQDYRVHRHRDFEKPPAKSTLHQEIVVLRQVLKFAVRKGWINFLPDMSVPYRSSGKVSHRAWFSPEEYRLLYTATRLRIDQMTNKRHRRSAEQLHDKILFMANTGLRPDEIKQLQFRDVVIVEDVAAGGEILEIEVRGKRGTGYCKSMPGAVFPFRRLKDRNETNPINLVFPNRDHQLFSKVLVSLDLKHDRDENPRTFYSLRHSYISFRLLEGADIYQIAKNCRTSVEMIEKHYAVHLKNVIDASAINVRKTKR